MTFYSLDTNACIVHLRSRGTSSVSRRLIAADPRSIVICSVVRMELSYGSYRAGHSIRGITDVERFVSRFLSADFDDNAANECARLRAGLMSRNQQIGPYDALIASIALVNNHTLITHNTEEFSRVRGLQIEDWQ